jgi:Flp pilus assembly protein TadG
MCFVSASNTRRGIALLWAVVALTALLAMASLAVDLGRARMAKAELQDVADAAARTAALSMQQGASSARASAIALAASSRVDGAAMDLRDSDVTFGSWNNGTFTPVASESNLSNANAVRVVTSRSSARGNAVPLLLASAFGHKTIDVNATSTVVANTNQSVDTTVDGVMNLWFAGQNSSATANYAGDVSTATQSSPRLVTGLNLMPGASLEFSATGQLSNVPWTYNNTPDGDGWICTNWTDNLGGMANCNLPINAVMGVFLTDADPRSSAAPDGLDFSTPESRDYTTLAPAIAQPFFIGDGRTSGGLQQKIVVPPGATRLYLGSMDPYGWWNNAGTANVNIRGTTQSIVVR